MNSTSRPHVSYACENAAQESRITASMVGGCPVARLIDPVSFLAPTPVSTGDGSTTTTLILVAVTPREVAPPLSFGAGATQYGPAVVVITGNVPQP